MPETWRDAPIDSMLAKLWTRANGEVQPAFTPNDTLIAIREFEQIWPLAKNGPGHIVIADYNLEAGSIARCIAWAIRELRSPFPMLKGFTSREIPQEELLDLIDFFAALLSLENEERIVHGEEGYEFADKSKPPFAQPSK